MTPRPPRGWALAAALSLAACQQQAPTPAAQPQPATDAATADPAKVPTPAAPTDAQTQTPAAAPAAVDFVLPGDLRPGMRLDDLAARFGAANVQAGEVPGAEGETEQGALLFPDDPQRRAYLYFDDAKPRRLVLLRVVDPESRWSLDDGVRMGTPLAKLVELNGKPIRYYGLGWDYGGTIVSFGGGRLQPAEGAAITRGLQLTPIGDATDGYPEGEGEYASDDRHYPHQGERVGVGELNIAFAGDEPASESGQDADAPSDAGR